MPKPLKIYDLEFKTQKDCLEYFQNLLRQEEDLSLDEACRVRSLARRRHKRIRHGCIVDRQPHPTFKSLCFIVSGEPISIKQCISQTVLPQKTQVLRAMRNAIRSQMTQFKADAFKEGECKCAISGQALAWEEADVDHKFDELTFLQIAEEFANAQDLPLDDLPIKWNPKKRWHELHSQYINDWRIYHADKAILRVIHKDLN